MFTRLFALVLGATSACTSMEDYYPEGELTQVDGREFIVVAKPNFGQNVYFASPNEPTMKEAIVNAAVALPALNVRAIEQATGCQVVRETIRDTGAGGVFAAVDC